MTRLQILQSVARLVEDTKHQRISSKDKLLEISNGERDVSLKTKCLRAFDTSKSTVESQATYALPDRCVHIFSVQIGGKPIFPKTRDWMDDYELKNLDEETHWETHKGAVNWWLYQPETSDAELRLVYIPDSGAAGAVIQMHYAQIPETVIKPGTAMYVPAYAEEAVRLFGLFKCQAQLSTIYKDHEALAASAIWQRKALISERQYNEEIFKVQGVLEGFQGRKILQRDGTAGLIFSEDDY